MRPDELPKCESCGSWHDAMSGVSEVSEVYLSRGPGKRALWCKMLCDSCAVALALAVDSLAARLKEKVADG
jgi:hypothetical protein